MQEQTKDFLFFYSGPLSQFYLTNFEYRGVNFNSAEQAMMAHKALLFKDHKCYERIMSLNDPARIMAVGRLVANYSDAIWNTRCRALVEETNYCKFTQNKTLKSLILQTKGMIVECTPNKKWGCGLSIDDQRRHRRLEWLGSNWLGIALTNVREKIASEN